jgi:predicted SnoaL-like aldol condensation-catalyzing enzyme
MKRLTLSGLALAASAAAILFFSAGTTKAQEKMAKEAQFCDDFDQTVIIGGKLDQASKFLNDDFIEHNVGMLAEGLPAFIDKMKARQEAMAARGGGGRGRGRGRGGPAPTRTVFSHDDVVVFISVTPARPDPNDASKQLPPNTHFDVYKLKNGKISEHWD